MNSKPRASNMSLIVGHSEAKYLKYYISDIPVCFYSGYRINEIWDVFGLTADLQVIAILMDPNEILKYGCQDVYSRLQQLCEDLHDSNPSVKVIVSTILPCVRSEFPGGRTSDNFIREFKEVAHEMNEKLRLVENNNSWTVVDFDPTFIKDNGDVVLSYLCMDGFHLSFKGAKVVSNRFQDEIHKQLLVSEVPVMNTHTIPFGQLASSEVVSHCPALTGAEKTEEEGSQCSEPPFKLGTTEPVKPLVSDPSSEPHVSDPPSELQVSDPSSKPPILDPPSKTQNAAPYHEGTENHYSSCSQPEQSIQPPLKLGGTELEPLEVLDPSSEPPVLDLPSNIPSRQQLQQLIPVQSSNANVAVNRQIHRSLSAGTSSFSSDEIVVQPVGGSQPEQSIQPPLKLGGTELEPPEVLDPSSEPPVLDLPSSSQPVQCKVGQTEPVQPRVSDPPSKSPVLDLPIVRHAMPNTNTSTQTIIPATSQGFLTYRMDRKPRGWCVIINNEEFEVDKGDKEAKILSQRKGSKLDADNICSTFRNVEFNVKQFDNLTEKEMKRTLDEFAYSISHVEFDCFVCFILTHGRLNTLYGSNGKLVSIKDLMSPFQAKCCKSMAGKPKLFFFQACQTKKGNRARNEQSTEMFPDEPDFFLGFACLPGYKAYRNPKKGSRFIGTVCETLTEQAHRYHLEDIYSEVTRKVYYQSNDTHRTQCPAELSTLTKQLFFRSTLPETQMLDQTDN